MNNDKQTLTLSERSGRYIPQNAPVWAKRNPLTTLATVISTIGGIVPILLYLGLQPQPLQENEAYVTHQQFNILMTNLVTTVGEIEDDISELKANLEAAAEVAEFFGELETLEPAAGAVVEELYVPNESVADIVVIDEEPTVVVEEAPDLEQVFEQLEQAVRDVEQLQREQRTK